ncbi:MAG: radical SAM protein [Candidatus Gastranaerophilales bacterium]|nr:radical SAM protein [Candidatus Gastranaerophilales bacterium]
MKEIYLYKTPKKEDYTVSVGLAYPSTYFYGMSVLGFLSMFKELDSCEFVSAQRIFTDTKTLAFDPKHFDMLGFSCVFELDILQILKILKKYGLELSAQKRKNKPLIFAGGPVITANPEPFAEFFDFFIIGDGEGVSCEIAKVYKLNRHKNKNEILKELAKTEGIYVPSLYDVNYEDGLISGFKPQSLEVPAKVQKRKADLSECLFSPVISDKTFYNETAFIEIARGCPYECKFCTAHYHNMPCRFACLTSIKKAVKKTSRHAKKLVLIGAMISEHPDFEEICDCILKLQPKRDFQVELSSLNVKKVSQGALRLVSYNNNEISLAIESGSEALRRSFGKQLSNDDIFNTIGFYAQGGVKKITLYSMIGLPDETSGDIDEYIKLAVDLKNTFEGTAFTHIVSAFIPKPQTPYEREPRKNNAYLKTEMEKIKTLFKENDIGVKLPVLQNDAFNTLISQGDRRLGQFIKHIFTKNTPIKDIFKEYKNFMRLKNSKLKQPLIHFSKYIYRTKDNDKILPWGFID